MKRAIARLEQVFDATPRGNRSPPFALGPNTADLLEELDFAYDSSLFGHDEPYRPNVPVLGGPLRDFVELPVSWELDDDAAGDGGVRRDARAHGYGPGQGGRARRPAGSAARGRQGTGDRLKSVPDACSSRSSAF